MTKAFYTESDLDEMGLTSQPTRWRMRQANEFPNPVNLSPGRKAYPAKLIHDWIDEKSGAETSDAEKAAA